MDRQNRQTKNPTPYIIFVLIVIILIIFVFLIKYDVFKPKIVTNSSNTSYYTDSKIDVQKLNKYLAENNYSWRAKDSEHLQMYNSLSEEEKQNLEPEDIRLPEEIKGADIFGETIDEKNYQDYLNENTDLTNQNAVPITGMATSITNKDYTDTKALLLPNPPRNQRDCGSCAAFATVGAVETYLYNKFNKKYDFSEQYIMSYLNNMGCSGQDKTNYLYQITSNYNAFRFLNKYYPVGFIPYAIPSPIYFIPAKALQDNVINNMDLFKDYYNDRKWLDSTKKANFTKGKKWDIQTPIQQTLEINSPPVGLMLEKDVPLTNTGYDACEIIYKDPKNPNFAITGMSLKEYKKDLPKSISFDNKFCSDDADKPNPNLYKLTPIDSKKPIYFLQNFVKIAGKDLCDANKQKEVVKLIKKAIDSGSPVLTSMRTTESTHGYGKGVFDYNAEEKQKIKAEQKKGTFYTNHAVYIYGYGKDKTGREYWLLRNSWDSDWGVNGSFRMWIGNLNYLFECNAEPSYFKDGLLEEDMGKYQKFNTVYNQLRPIDNKISSSITKLKKWVFDKSSNLDQASVDWITKSNDISTTEQMNCNSVVPDYIKIGECQDGIGKTGSNNYYKDELDKLLLTWADVSDTDCDFGLHYCDQDQLRSTTSKKLDLKDSIILGDIDFKKFCYDNVCTGIYPAEGVNPKLFGTSDYILQSNDLNYNDLNKTNNYFKTKMQNIPDYLKKYIIVTTSFDKTANADNFFNQYLPEHYKYQLANRDYYQFRLDYWLDKEDSISKIKDQNITNIISLMAQNFNIYYGVANNKFLVITKDFGDLNSTDNKDIFTRTQFLDNSWKMDFSDSNVSKINFGIYEISISNKTDANRTAKVNITEIQVGSVNNNLLKQPINSITNEYPGLKLTENAQYSRKVTVNIIDDYSNWGEISNGRVLSFNTGNNQSITNLEYIDTTPVQLYFYNSMNLEPTINQEVDQNYSVDYIDSQGKSRTLFDSNKAYSILYLFDNYKYSGTQIQITGDCNSNCVSPIVSNTMTNYVDRNTTQTISIPSMIGNRKNDNILEELILGIKEGSICYSQNGDFFEFRHNPEYNKYMQYYAISNNDIDNFDKLQFDWSILVDLNTSYNSDINIYSNDQKIEEQSNNVFFVPDSITLDANIDNNDSVYFFWTSDSNMNKIQQNITDENLNQKSTQLSNQLILENNDYNYFKLPSGDKNISLLLKNNIQTLIFIKDSNGEYSYNYINLIINNDYNATQYNICNINKKIICNLYGCDSNITCIPSLDLDAQYILNDKLLNKEIRNPSMKCILNKEQDN